MEQCKRNEEIWEEREIEILQCSICHFIGQIKRNSTNDCNSDILRGTVNKKRIFDKIVVVFCVKRRPMFMETLNWLILVQMSRIFCTWMQSRRCEFAFIVYFCANSDDDDNNNDDNNNKDNNCHIDWSMDNLLSWFPGFHGVFVHYRSSNDAVSKIISWNWTSRFLSHMELFLAFIHRNGFQNYWITLQNVNFCICRMELE